MLNFASLPARCFERAKLYYKNRSQRNKKGLFCKSTEF